MKRSIRRLSRITAMSCCITWAAACVLAAPAAARMRHHVSLGMGSTTHSSDRLVIPEFGLDFTEAFNIEFAYRYSISERLDLTIEAQDNEASSSPTTFDDAELTLSSWFTGPGVRYYPSESALRPFVQVSVYYVRETIGLQQFGEWTAEGRSGAGFGLMAGFELLSTWRCSLPMKVQYLFARPADDVSGFGFNVAIAYNRGPRF